MDFVKMEYRDVAFSQGRQGPELTIDYTQYDIAAVPCRMALIESSMFGIPFQGYDSYRDGKGGMKGVIAKLITLFDQKGKEMDRACLATYLAESMFIPTALLQDCMEFDEIDDFHVKASISAYGDKVSGIFTFNELKEAYVTNSAMKLQAQTMAFTTLAISEIFHMLNMSSVEKSSFRVFKNKNWMMAIAFAFAVVLQFVVIEIPGVRAIFSTSSLDWREWILTVSLSLSPLLIHEIIIFVKWIIKKTKKN